MPIVPTKFFNFIEFSQIEQFGIAVVVVDNPVLHHTCGVWAQVSCCSLMLAIVVVLGIGLVIFAICCRSCATGIVVLWLCFTLLSAIVVLHWKLDFNLISICAHVWSWLWIYVLSWLGKCIRCGTTWGSNMVLVKIHVVFILFHYPKILSFFPARLIFIW